MPERVCDFRAQGRLSSTNDPLDNALLMDLARTCEGVDHGLSLAGVVDFHLSFFTGMASRIAQPPRDGCRQSLAWLAATGCHHRRVTLPGRPSALPDDTR
jgi:hypothetical protein